MQFKYLDKHVFVRWKKVGFVLKVVDAEVDDVGEELFDALNLIQSLLQQSPNPIVGRQKHGQILTLLKSLFKVGGTGWRKRKKRKEEEKGRKESKKRKKEEEEDIGNRGKGWKEREKEEGRRRRRIRNGGGREKERKREEGG